jgi:hypothetical protein
MPEANPAATRSRTRWLGTALFVALVVAPLVAVAFISSLLFRPAGTVLEIEMRPTGGTAAQIFWTSTWAFSAEESSTLPLHQRPGEYERFRFPLPSRPLLFIRFDPINGAGEVLIRSMRVLDRDGRTVRTIDPIVMAALYQIEGIVPVGQDVRVVTTKNADDPMLMFKSAWLTEEPSWHSLQFVTPFSLAWISAAWIALVVAALGFLARDVLRGPVAARDVLWLAAIFMVTFWAKLLLVEHYPMPVPFWDQWDGEGSSLYLPFQNGGLTWHQMFTLHNEHRIFFTRALAMALIVVNGQWDPHLQIAVNAGLHALVAVVFAVMLWLAAARRWLPLIAVTIGLGFAPPFALENTLAGFQSAFYFLVLFAGLAIWLMGTHRPGTRAWFVGWLCAFCSIVTVGGGVLTLAPIAALVLLQLFNAPREWRQALVNVAALAVVAAVGYAALSPPLHYHEFLKAGTWLAFKVSFARNLAFPWVTSPRVSVLVWVPLMLVSVAVLVRRLKTTGLEQVTLALGAWVVVQAATIAYSRGVNGAIPASRYLDMLSFGFVVNTLAFVALVDGRQSRFWKRATGGALVLWLLASAVGVTMLSQTTLADAGREKRVWMENYVRNIRHLVVTGDLATFVEKRAPSELPYFSPMMLAGWLSHPYIRGILPPSVRQPIALEAKPDADQTFGRTTSDKDLLTVWDSYTGGRSKAQGRFESQPIACADYGQVRFEIAGAPTAPGMQLFLKPVDGGRETRVRTPLFGAAWTAVSVSCPGGPFTVVAVDRSPTAWFAFRQPAEIGWASSIAESMIQQSWAFGVAALVLTILAVVAPRARPRPAGD